MGVAVLNYQPEHPLRIFYRQSVGHGRPEIMDVKKESTHFDLAQQRVYCFGHGVEGVGIVLWRFGEAEPRQVWRDNMRDLGQRPDDVAEQNDEQGWPCRSSRPWRAGLSRFL